MPEYLTYVRALELLREVVAEKGEGYIYSWPDGDGCYYVHGDEPGCGVGHVLYRAGWPLSQLAAVDMRGNSCVHVIPAFCDNAQPAAITLLRTFQEAQDAGATWGAALRTALEAGDRDD